LKQVLLGSTHILRTPESSVVIRDISEEAIDFELSYPVTDVSAISAAQNELFDRVYRAVGATGARFSPRLALAPAGLAQQSEAVFQAPERLFAGIVLFWGLTPAESTALRSQMQRTEFKPGEVIIKSGTILNELYLLSEGVVAVTVEAAGSTREVMRLTPGEYFGESSMLTGVPLKREITAVTRVVVYKISKAALAPLLKARPAIADQLSQTLAARQLAYRTVPESSDEEELPRENLADRIAAEIRRLFLGSL
jgi:CRP-like cAMP-binding protein